MRLPLNRIYAFTRGCGDLSVLDGEVFFDRIGAAGRAYYDPNPAWHLRARCPAGVVIEMKTDASAVHIHMRVRGGARPYATVDAVVENCLVSSVHSNQIEGDLRGILDLPPCDRARLVQIYLPHSAAANLVSMDLVEANSVEPIEPARTLLALGDSITQGMDAVHPSQTYAAIAARQLRMGLQNYAIGGAVFARESFPKPPMMNPDLITIAYGTNDFTEGRSVDMARGYLEQVRVLFPDTPIAVLMPLWRMNGDVEGWRNSSGMSISDYRNSLHSIVDELNFQVIEHQWLLPAVTSLYIDGLHPCDVGHSILGMNLANRLARIFD